MFGGGISDVRDRSRPLRFSFQARRPLLRTEHIQKRRKAESLDGTYTRSLQMVKYISWKDKQNTCEGYKRESDNCLHKDIAEGYWHGER